MEAETLGNQLFIPVKLIFLVRNIYGAQKKIRQICGRTF